VKALLRLSGIKEYVKSSLWVLPALFVAAALVVGTALSERQPELGTVLEPFVFGGTASGARELLSALAGAMITVTGLTFSLTVVALQMASSQYSPRVLRGFLSDRGNQLVLSSLVGTFAYTVAVLRNIREGVDGQDEVLPALAVTLAVLFSLGALGMLVYFLHHLTRQLRVETILRDIAEDTAAAIRRVFPDGLEDDEPPIALPEPGEHAVRVRAKRSGYLQAVERSGLVRNAAERDVVVRLQPSVGTHLAEGTTLAWVWCRGGRAFDDDELDGLDTLVHDRVQLGPERTMQQDVSFGIRQLVDVGAKALSTGMNDPTTAVEALGQLSVVTCLLTSRRLGSAVDRDEDGQVRSILPRPEYRDYLHLICDQIRRYGTEEPAIAIGILDVLVDAAEQTTHADRHAAIQQELDRTLEVVGRELDATEMVRIDGYADIVRSTLDGGRRPPPEVAAG
jgi:uncharacterized membrane protein